MNEKIAIYSEKYGEITYGKLLLERKRFVSMFHCSKVRPLLLIRCSISYETVLGYIAAIEAHIPIIMCDDKSCESAINTYAPQYIWQMKDALSPYGYDKCGVMYGYILYCRISASELLLTVGFVRNQSAVFVRKLPVLMPALMKYRHVFYKNSPSSTSCTA